MNITDLVIKSICSPTIYKRGLEYFKDGRVHMRLREDKAIAAHVDGEELYNVRIDFSDDGRIFESLCTCPYYQTMNSPCKHIVATLKARQEELVRGSSQKNENDRLAQVLCREFADNCFEKQRLNLKYTMNIMTTQSMECKFYISLKAGFDELKIIDGIDNFFNCYINMTDFKLSKHTAINSSKYSLSDTDTKIIEILCEAYQNKVNSGIYSNRISQTEIASATAKRLFPYLAETECEFCLNSIPLSDLRIINDNPDIVIDINATDNEISLNVFENGISLFKDGSWFFYEGTLYHTEPEWRSWFMPIYNLLVSQSRTQIDFKGSTRIDFATYVYPKLRNKQGVVTTGIESILINEKPEFSIYLDYNFGALSAVINAKYGKMSIRLPNDTFDSEKIVIRDLSSEDSVVSHFSRFTQTDGVYTTNNIDDIYEFIFSSLDKLESIATIYKSDSVNLLLEDRKIILNTSVRYNKDIDLLEVDYESDLTAEEIIGILNALESSQSFYKFNDGGFLRIDNENSKKFKLFDSFGFSDKDIRKGHKQLSKYHLLYISALSNEGSVKTDETFDELIKNIKSIKANIPKNLNKVLRKYQKDGVLWLKQLSELGFGGILADDMGLGKTLEVIAFVMGEERKMPALIVAPSALTYNWLREIEKFTPEAKAKIIDGNKEERTTALDDIEEFDFIITSYPLIRRDYELFLKYKFSYMFIDESQHIKNPDTMSAKAVKRINADRKFALSGTPIENRLSELWSVFDFVMKGYLYSNREFSQKYEKSARDNFDMLDELRKKISPFVLRRMKSDVLSELPEKIENTIYSEFVPEQKKMYDAFRVAAKNEVTALFDEVNSGMKILTFLLRLRQICCHPLLFDKSYKKDSGKLLLLEELVDSAISQGHRILIFSQFTSMLEIIKKRLIENGKECFYIDGKTPSYLRSELAQRFNDGEKDLFLVSLKAGGTGLNLIGADTVILYDPWWNPAVMEQASDRAYRIGQTKAVQVIRLAAKGTIEEQILKLQENKKNLANSVIKKNERTISGLTKDEILSLFE